MEVQRNLTQNDIENLDIKIQSSGQKFEVQSNYGDHFFTLKFDLFTKKTPAIVC